MTNKKKKHAADAKRAREKAKRELAKAEQLERLASDFDALKPEDFDVTVGNDGKIDKQAAKQKRQEYSRSMGEFASGLRAAAMHEALDGTPVEDSLPDALGTYIGKLAEQEARFGNRRVARSISLAEAHEALSIRRFKAAAKEYLTGKIVPKGCATKRPNRSKKRTLCVLLSDLHLGAELSALDNPMPFRAIEEARRLEFVLRQALDYKPQYRSDTKLLLLLNGDLIQGQLMHDLRDGAPLTEQKVIFWRLMSQFIGECAAAFEEVHVECQPGNHGRDKVRHPGRATSRKWDGHEWEMYYALSQMGSHLKNVTWGIPFRAVSIIDLHGSKLLMTHGDTEIKLAAPGRKAEQNAAMLDKINSNRLYDTEFQAACFGHFHFGMYQPGPPGIIYNGALIPPDGYARTEGYFGQPCGQFLWEAVEGYPIGDLRFVRVDESQDRDEKLGKLIAPFRFDF